MMSVKRVLLAAIIAYSVGGAADEFMENPQPARINASEPSTMPATPPATPELATTPQPDIAITLEPSQTVKVLTVEQWHAVRRIHPDRQVALARIAWCESRFDAQAMGDGGHSLGAWQVQPRFWGPVPTTLEEQAEQADRIAAEHGLEPWTTRHGCEGWSR